MERYYQNINANEAIDIIVFIVKDYLEQGELATNHPVIEIKNGTIAVNNLTLVKIQRSPYLFCSLN